MNASAPSSAHYQSLTDILGRQYVDEPIQSPFDFIHLAEKGLDAHIIRNFREHFKLSLGATAEMLNVSEPTIYRWVRNGKKLDRNFSVQLFEIADLFLYGTQVFGEVESFRQWLALPNTALGGMPPSKLVGIPGGISKVRDLIGRIEYGVYS